MDSHELFDYVPKTIVSSGSKVVIDDRPFIDTTCHSITQIKDYTLIHDFRTKGYLDHKIWYINDRNTIYGNIVKRMDSKRYNYAFLLDENKIIYYDENYIALYENDKSRKLFEYHDNIFFRLDDSKNIIILYDQKFSDKIKFKMTILRKDDDYKCTDVRDYNVRISSDSDRCFHCNYYNLLFVSEVNECIMDYYQHSQLYYIILVQYDDKNNYYDILVYSNGQSYAWLDRWTETPSNNWIREEILKVNSAEFHLLNKHFHRQIITNYCCESYNFGSVVSESYGNWKKRMLEILVNATEKLSTDLLKIIICFI